MQEAQRVRAYFDKDYSPRDADNRSAPEDPDSEAAEVSDYREQADNYLKMISAASADKQEESAHTEAV